MSQAVVRERAAIAHLVAHITGPAKGHESEAVKSDLLLASKHLRSAFNLSETDIEQGKALANSFVDTYYAGAATQVEGDSSSTANQGDSLQKSPTDKDFAFNKFIERLKVSTAFFAGATEGTPEYEERVAKARAKFDSKLNARAARASNQRTETAPTVAAADTAEAPGPSLDSKKEQQRAESLKEEGNTMLKALDYAGAEKKYSLAIHIDGKNPKLYSNRAAALMHLERYTEAIADCEQAISLDPSFLRPRERLASVYRKLGMFDLERGTLKEASERFPDDERLASELAAAAQREESGVDSAANSMSDRAAGSTGAGNFPGVPPNLAGGGSGGGAGGGGSGPDLSGLMAMAGRLAEDPAVQNVIEQSSANGGGLNPQALMQNIAQNPELMQTMMQSMSGMLGGGAGSNPSSREGDSHNDA